MSLVVAVSVLGSGGLVATVADGAGRDGAARPFRACPPGVATFQLDSSDPIACVHADVPPPGVDVNEHVSTAELLKRDGNGPKAAAAAEAAGLAVPAAVSSPTRNVACDGDGSSGYRVQAVYVFDPTKPPQTNPWSDAESYNTSGDTGGDRFTLVKPKIQEWAAGVDATFRLSAALTGGARSVRWVTEPDGQGGCVPTVLKVASTAISDPGLTALAADLKNQGLGAANRKYLLWTDATMTCGLANMYPTDSQAAQANVNNGGIAMYARVDTGCWGLQHTEAHELTHTLGAVLATAPHKTAAGHCTDESDVMCYPDGPGVTMRDVCPAQDEALLDCNGDDYFNTFPKPGSYLTTSWNAANSRFLIGGGDGTVGGNTGTNRTEVFGVNGVTALPTQVSATAVTPAGRTHTTAFSTRTQDCTTSGGAGDQGLLACRPGVASASVTAVVTDSAGVKSEASTLVTFEQAARPATLTITTPSVPGCQTAPVTITGDLVDTTTSTGVYGATVDFRQGSTVVGRAQTDLSGHVVASLGLIGLTPVTASVSDDAFAGATVSGPITVTGTCQVTSVSSTVDELHPMWGGSVMVTGTAYNDTTTVADADVTVTLGNASVSTTTDAEGGFEVTLQNLQSGGDVQVTANGVGPFTGDSVDVTSYASSVTASSTGTMTGRTAVVTGVVNRTDPYTGASSPVAGVQVQVTGSGNGWPVTSAPTDAKGAWTVTTPVLSSTQTVTAGVSGQPGLIDSSTTAKVSVASYVSAVTLSGGGNALLGTTPQLTGKLTFTDTSGSPDASGRTIRVVVTTGGVPTTTTVTTGTGGAFTVALPAVTASSSVVAYFDAATPWPAAQSAAVAVTATKPVFTTALTLDTAPTSVLTGSVATVGGSFTVRNGSGTAVAPTGAQVAVTSTQSGQAAVTQNVTVASTGRWTATIPSLKTATTVTARFLGSGNASSTWAATAPTAARTITVIPPTYTTATAITTAPGSVYYGTHATVSGKFTVTANAGTAPSPANFRIRVVVTPSGLAATTVYATTTSTGAWTVSTPAITRSTTVSAFFDKTGSWPASPGATRTVNSVNYGGAPVVSTSTTKLTGAGTATVTGVAYKTAGTTRTALPGARVTVANYDVAGVARTRTTVTADASGKFTARLAVAYNGTLRVSQAAATGVNAGSAANRSFTVVFRPAISVSTTAPKYNSTVTAYTSLSPARSGIYATLQRYAGGKWTSFTRVRTDKYGKTHLSVKASAKGTVKYRLVHRRRQVQRCRLQLDPHHDGPLTTLGDFGA